MEETERPKRCRVIGSIETPKTSDFLGLLLVYYPKILGS